MILKPLTEKNFHYQPSSLKHLLFLIFTQIKSNHPRSNKIILREKDPITTLALKLDLICPLKSKDYDSGIQMYEGSLLLDWLYTLNESKLIFESQSFTAMACTIFKINIAQHDRILKELVKKGVLITFPIQGSKEVKYKVNVHSMHVGR